MVSPRRRIAPPVVTLVATTAARRPFSRNSVIRSAVKVIDEPSLATHYRGHVNQRRNIDEGPQRNKPDGSASTPIFADPALRGDEVLARLLRLYRQIRSPLTWAP
jgi:hypothetical protein